MTPDPLATFGPAVQSWFRAAFPAPTAVQTLAFPTLSSPARPHALLLAPTGTGKTLAAFLASLDRLVRRPADDREPGVRVLYVSPLKALVADIERNLRGPLVGIANAAQRVGAAHAPVRVDLRTGDTSARERRLQLREPAEILVTTPESLYLLLGSSARETLRTVDTVILDEIHAVAGTKRGVHLALSLERLSDLTAGRGEPQRVGLSATQRPLEEIAAFLGGDRPVEILDASQRPDLDLQIVVPVEDMENALTPTASTGGEGLFQRVGGDSKGPERLSGGMWPAIYPRLLALIRAHRSTLVFVNSRLSCERLAQRLNELAGEELVRAHHGSLSHEQRARLEDDLKAGRVPGLVATSSLELGIDMGAIDLVVLVESPGSVSSGLQRVGRAGHQVGVRSIGRLFPKHRGDLVEAAVVAARMLEAAVEPTRVPRNCLDVLAQQLVAMVCDRPRTVEEAFAMVRRAYPYRDLPRSSFVAVLDMLAGRYPTDEFADLAPRVVWDRATDTLTERKGARLVAVLNGGTIPDRGLYGVFMAGEGRRLGELDEEMVYESRRGDLVVLGASTWRIEEITRDKVVVSPAPGEPGRLPFWHGDRPGRSVEVGRAVGGLLREVAQRAEPDEALAWLAANFPLDALACRNLVRYVAEQRAATAVVPSDRAIVVESFRDELGDWRVCVLTPFGARVHAPWALLLEHHLSRSFDVKVLWGDDGLALRFADLEQLPPTSELFPDPEGLADRLVEQLQKSALFSARFRENAARSLLLPKRTRQGRQPLWAMRLRAQNLQGVALQFPAFPVVLETFRECLQDVLDLPSLEQLLGDVRSRKIRVHDVETARPSPFARSLVFAWVAAYMYEGDTPLAERRAMALSVDRSLLAELLGDDELRDLLDPAVIAAVEAELQQRHPERRARHPDGLCDLLRRQGDLSTEEVAERTTEDPRPWLESLLVARRVVRVRVAGEERFLAIEDAGRVRDGLGVSLPGGVPQVFLEPVPDAIEGLVARYARVRGPFATEAAARRLGLPVDAARLALAALHARGKVSRGARGEGEWCDAEVLRLLKRRTLAALRQEIAAVDAPTYASFLAGWHGVGGDRQGLGRLREVVAQLEGLPIVASLLEEEVLPARIAGFTPELLDQLGAMGEVVWVGRGALGPRDGRVALVTRQRVDLLLDPPPTTPLLDEVLPARVMAHLHARGACFLFELLALDPDAAAVTEALWALAFAGYVTNDTFQPLRALRARKTGRGRPGVAAGGRWSAVSSLFAPGAAPAPTARHVARAAGLLERYGVVGAAAAHAEELPGGFTQPYEVLRSMEEAGKVRRGHFVDGFSGAQFAAPGVVDRLRGHRVDDGAVTTLAAADPASPWGSLLDWPRPELVADAPRPRRVGGARVVSIGGRPALFVEKGERGVLVLDPDEERLLAALQGLLGRERDRWRSWKVEKVDGLPPAQHPRRAVFEAAGFQSTAVGLQRSR